MAITEDGTGSLRCFVPTRSLRERAGSPTSGKPQRKRRGLWVVLLGPDGAGKSSVIAGLASGRAAGFVGCETYHLRPALWLKRKGTGANCDPHGQRARGAMISVFKLAYLLAANCLAYVIKVRPQLAQGNLVLLDRYFPDCLVDPKRYRLPASCKRVAELVAQLVPQPDQYVVLDAPVSALQERKREVAPAESEQQRKGYATLLQTMQKVVVVDASRPLSVVVEDVLDHIIELHLEQCRKEYEIA